MRIFVIILAFVLISCQRETPAPTPTKKESSSSAESSSSFTSSSSEQNAPPPSSSPQIKSSSSQSPVSSATEHSLTVQNASGSGTYAPQKKIPIQLMPPSQQCFAFWKVSPGRYKKNLKLLSTDSAEFLMPDADVTITAKFKPCDAKGIVVGNLRWMNRNLNVQTSSGSFCYKNQKKNCDKYGRLYDFETAQTVCPEGWRLPSDAEWESLVQFLGTGGGTKLKSKNGWQGDEESSGNGTDEIHFTAMPSGIVYEGNFMYQGAHAYFWSSTEKDSLSAYYRSLDYDSPDIYRYHNFKTAGYAVRCVQDVQSSEKK